LSTDIAELSNEAEDHVILLVKWSLANLVSELISSEVLDSGGIEHLLRNFWQLSDEEQDSNGNAGAGDSEVDELDIDQVVCVLASEEKLGGNERADERCNAIPRLTELKSGRCAGRVTDDNSVGIGRSFKSCKSTSNHESAGTKSTEGSNAVFVGREVSGGPEEDGSQRVKRKAHKYCDLVAFALHDFSSNGREQEVTTAEVNNLKTGRLELGDVEDGLEMLVEHIKKAITEPPEEEQADDEGEREDECLSTKESRSESWSSEGNSAASHCEKLYEARVWKMKDKTSKILMILLLNERGDEADDVVDDVYFFMLGTTSL